jgi:hypothetical protein
MKIGADLPRAVAMEADGKKQVMHSRENIRYA